MRNRGPQLNDQADDEEDDDDQDDDDDDSAESDIQENLNGDPNDENENIQSFMNNQQFMQSQNRMPRQQQRANV